MGGGYNCAVPGCRNTYHNSAVSFFRFPKDLDRAKLWVLACGRTELLPNLQNLHYAERICGVHFESRMFLNNIGNRLQKNAIPTNFFPKGASGSKPESYQLPRSQEASTSQVAAHSHASTTITLQNDSSDKEEDEPEENPLELSTQAPILQTTIASFLTRPTAVRPYLSRYRRWELKQIIKELEKENADLRKEMQENYLKHSDPLLWEVVDMKTKGQKFSTEFKSFSLSLYFLGPKLYNKVISKQTFLPDLKVLRNFVGQTQLTPGTSENATDLLKSKFRHFQPQHRFCTLCVDEIKLTPGLYYGTSSDKIIGFQDVGNDERRFKPALLALVIMAKGLYSSWQQPIGYYFTHSPFSGEQLKDIVLQQISQLNKIELKVVATIFNMTENIINMARILEITPESPYFKCGTQKITFLYNTHQLLRETRDDLIDKCFVIGTKTTSWTHLHSFVDQDKKHPIRSAPYLTESHLFPKKQDRSKLRYATAIFNDKLVHDINLYLRFNALPPDAEATMRFIRKVSDLFRALNCAKSQKVRKGIDDFQKYYDFFKTLEVISETDNDVPSSTKSILGWKTTIRGVQTLIKMLNSENLKLPKTFAINFDCLKRFCGSFKNSDGKSVNPTPIKFYRAYKKLFRRCLMSSGLDSCEEDYLKMKANLEEKPADQYSTEMTNLINLDLDYQQNKKLSENFTRNICRYLIRKCSAKHTCPTCDDYLRAHKDLLETLAYHIKVHKSEESLSFQQLDSQNDNFVYFVASMEMMFQQNYEDMCCKSNVIHEFTTLFNKLNYQHPCQQFPYYYVFEMYARIRLFYSIKTVNQYITLGDTRGLIIWK